jgi:hypothetical protein
MAYGIRIGDSSGNKLLLSSGLISIVSSGRVSMPAGLNADNTYGVDIDLPGIDAIPESALGVLVKGFIININLVLHPSTVNYSYAMSWLMNNTFTFYERNETTGVMTVWTPYMVSPDYDACLSSYPVTFWDKLGQTNFTSIRLFAATCYLVYDQSAGVYKKIYSIGSQGIEKVDYAIYMKRYSNITERAVRPSGDAMAIAEAVSMGVV